MTTTRVLSVLGGLALLGVLAWAVGTGVERVVDSDPAAPAPAETVAGDLPAAPVTAHIEATIFHGSPDGSALVPIRRRVALADDVLAQGREILAAQLQPPPAPYTTVIPAGTTLRAFYVTGRGEAFVDLSPEVTTTHPGGSMAELLTVYAIVNVVTSNLPAVQRVQILVDGREVETIAGHVDVRRPLAGNASLVREP